MKQDLNKLKQPNSVSRESINSSVKKMAVGTLVSRILGLVRILVIGYALGIGHTDDAYNLANTTPNILHDLVLGGILSATFVPIFTKKLSTLSSKDAWEQISSVVTLAGIVLITATVLFEILAPVIISVYTIGTKTDFNPATKNLAIELLRFFLPQIMFYGFVGISGALLNCVGKFSPITNSPIYGNIVSILILLEVTLISKNSATFDLASNNKLLFLLGIGTTAGIAVQFLSIVPSLVKSHLPLRFNFNFRSEAIREILHMSAWSFGFVVVNQIALFVVLALTASAAVGSVTAYTFGFTFFQLPYWLFAVSIATAVAPKISHFYVLKNLERTKSLVLKSLNTTVGIMLPISAFYLVVATPMISTLFEHGATTSAGVILTADTLKMFSVGLLGYSLFMLTVRILLSMQQAKHVFFIYLFENILNIILAFIFINRLGVKGIALSIAIAYTTSAILGIGILIVKLNGINMTSFIKTLFKSLMVSFAVGVGSAVASLVYPNNSFYDNFADTLFGFLAAVAILFILGSLFSNKSNKFARTTNKL
jgi:putative peptidoglycan lipid II flippase